MTVAEAFRAALIGHMGEIVGGIVLLLGAAFAYAVSWLRTHTTQSAVRQAQSAHGDTPQADQAAADELHRMPGLLRPRDVPKAIAKANERERRVRVSTAPARVTEPPESGIIRPITGDFGSDDKP